MPKRNTDRKLLCIEAEPQRNTAIYRRIRELEAEVLYLKTVIKSQADLIAELKCRIDPYSQDCEPLCN